MTETARILNTATSRSLVILDEIGRGTSTYDGMSLAWSVVEHLHEHVGCRTLFATHYHELTDLEKSLPGVKNLNVAVREWQDDVVFLHKIVEGAADKSYGIHVARLAGVPRAVIERSKDILAQLEEEHLDASGRAKIARPVAKPQTKRLQLTLFERRRSSAAGRIPTAGVGQHDADPGDPMAPTSGRKECKMKSAKSKMQNEKPCRARACARYRFRAVNSSRERRMKTKENAMLVAGVCLVCGLFMGGCLGWFLHRFSVADAQSAQLLDTQHKAGHDPKKPHPHLSQKTNRVDLEGGVTFAEIIGVAENGEVWLRTSFISRNGERLLMRGWDKFMGKNETGRNLSQFCYYKDKVVLMEADQDGDGILDLLVLFDDAELPIQAFDIKKEGVLSPVSSDRVKKMHEDWKLAGDILKPMVEGVKKGANMRERKKAIEDAIKKAQNVGR